MTGQLREVDTPQGRVVYTLVRKRVKNLNLRLDRMGQATLSVPLRCALAYADDFVRRKTGWIIENQRKLAAKVREPSAAEMGREECLALLRRAVDEVYPLAAQLGVAYPEVKIRKMKSQWGNCHWAQGYITLNTALVRCPEELRRYVALHELIHFLHHNHGPEFYTCMDALMPEWKIRRAELKEYVGALEV